ncbi:MAG TPA: hypothetical protein VF171_02860 [Trueperaceae bacterium]
MTEVELSDGTVLEFPDGMSREQIKAAIQKRFKPQQQAAPTGAPDIWSPEFEQAAYGVPADDKRRGWQKLLGLGADQRAAAFDVARARLLSDDEAVADAIKRRIPGSTGDGAGVTVGGQQFQVNPEGIDPADVAGFAAKTTAFLPAARLAGTAAGLTGRMALGGGAAAGTEVALQNAGGREHLDAGGVALAGLGGAGGELAGPLVSAIFRHAKQAAMPASQAVQKGREFLARMQAQGAIPEGQLATLGRRLDEVEAGVKPDDVLSEQEFGFLYTRGQKTGDYKQLRREEMLRTDPESQAGQIMRSVDERNTSRAFDAVDELTRRVAGGPPRDVVGAVDDASRSVRRQEGSLRERVGAAYERAGSAKAHVLDEGRPELPWRVRNALGDMDVTQDLTPATHRALQILDGTFSGANSRDISLQGIERARKQLGSLYDAARNPADRRGITLARKELDGWLDDVAERGLVQGDPEAIKLLKEARSLRGELGARFGDSRMGQQVDKIVRTMVEDGADPERLAQMIYGANEVSGPTARRALVRVKQALGDDKASWDQLRGAVLAKAMTRKTGDRVGLSRLEANLKQLLTQRPTLMKEILSPEELGKVQRLTAALGPLLKQADGRSSGTAERLFSMVRSVTSSIPGLGIAMRALTGPGQVAAAYRATAPVRPAFHSAVPGAAGAAWAGGQD